MITFLLSHFLIFLEFISSFFIGYSFCEIKIQKKYIIPLTLIITFLDTIVINFAFNSLTYIKLFFTFTVIFVFYRFIFNGKTSSQIFAALVSSIMLLIFDYATVFAVMVITDTTLEQILNSIYSYVITTFTSKFLCIVVSFLISKAYRQYKNNSDEINPLEWFLMAIFPLVSFIMLALTVKISMINNDVGFLSFCITVGIFIANIAVLSVISKLSADKQIKQDNALLNQQLKMGMDNIEALNSAYSQQRKLTHDFNNHLSVIRSLLEGGDAVQAKEYTANLLNASVSVSRLFDSGNRIVDTLLTQKYNHAKDLGIKMQVLVEDLSGVSMSADKLVVVLSNLLDNAIEACTAATGEKMIKVKFTAETGGHILTVQNTAATGPVAKDNLIVSTKEDKLNHGYGIKNICSVLDGYGYPYHFNYADGWFSFTAMMME